jgi:hypothetical protein
MKWMSFHISGEIRFQREKDAEVGDNRAKSGVLFWKIQKTDERCEA